MNLQDVLGAFTPGDVILVLIFLAAFVAGYIQGLVRQVIGLFIWFVALVVALNLREPAGGWLEQYWTQFPPEYTAMLATIIIFLVVLIGGNLAAQVFYKRVPILANQQLADELLGGVLSLGVRILEVAALLYILDTFYRTQPPVGSSGVAVFNGIFDLFKDSAIAEAFRNSLTPGLIAILGPFVPGALRSLSNS